MAYLLHSMYPAPATYLIVIFPGNCLLANQTSNQKIIVKSAGIVGIAVMCSRFLGLIREQVFAGLFGAGYANDAFVVAFRIPNLLRDLFGEGALSAAFVKVFTAYDTNKSQEETWKLASNVLTFILILLSCITLLGIFFADSIVHVLAPDFDLIQGKAALTEKLTIIMMPFLVFISLSAVVMGILNTKGRFFIPALASSFFNLGSIVGGTVLALTLPRYGQPAIVGMAVGTLLGGFLQLGIQIPSLLKTGFRYKPTLNLADSGLHQILKLMIPATIGLSATQLTLFVNTNFASSCAEGSVSWLYYAFRLVQLPIGIFGVALSIAILPVLARQAAKKSFIEMKDTMVTSLTMVFALCVPATAGLIILSEPIIRVIYERGAFTSADTLATAQTLSLYAVGLFAYSANKILVPAFYALDKTRFPVIASFISVGLNIVFIKLTIEQYQHLAIALSTSLTMLFNFLFLIVVLYRSLHGFAVRTLLIGIVKIVVSSLVLSCALIYTLPFFANWLDGTIFHQIAALTILVCTAAGLYAVCLHLLKLSEMSFITQKIHSRFSR